MADSPQEWYYSLPPVTRTYLTLAVLTTAGISFGLVNPYNIVIVWPAITEKYQVRRTGEEEARQAPGCGALDESKSRVGGKRARKRATRDGGDGEDSAAERRQRVAA